MQTDHNPWDEYAEAYARWVGEHEPVKVEEPRHLSSLLH